VCPWIGLLAACSPSAPDPVTPEPPTPSTPSPTTPAKPPPLDCPGEVAPPGVAAQPHPAVANLQIATLSLDEPATTAVRCTAEVDPADELLWESTRPRSAHTLRLGGLVAERRYRCVAAATCPPSAPVAFDLTTGELPARIPATEVVTHDVLAPDPTVPHFIVNHTRHCEGDLTHRLLVYDLGGDLRWYYNKLPGGTPIAINANYLGGGRFLWGGGWTPKGATEVLDLDHTVLQKAAFPGSGRLVFHHEGRQMPDGTLLTLTQSRNDVGGPDWEGFTVRLVDPATDSVTWDWDSQQGVDAGLLPTGEGDVYHANAAEVFDTSDGPALVVSLCFLPLVIAVDVATEEIRWRFGPGGDFELRDVDGNPLPDTQYPDCQHGVELLDGHRLLVYDNGRYFRDHSRASEYALDPVRGIATLTWTWTEPDWHEGAVGDVDALPGSDRVLITQAHPDCWSAVPGDVSASVEVERESGEVVWRHRFLDPQDATYRSDRFDACDAFPQLRYCPEVAARAADLSELLGDPN